MGKIRKCGNCGKEMEFLGEEQIQLGQPQISAYSSSAGRLGMP